MEPEPIYIFEVEATYLFKHYFERTDIFAELQEYYSDADYRIEVPTHEFPAVEDLLERNYYEPTFVDDIEAFALVKEQYSEHGDILRNAEMQWTRQGHYFFIMKDPLAVDQAIEQNACRLEETDLVLGILSDSCRRARPGRFGCQRIQPGNRPARTTGAFVYISRSNSRV